MPVGVFIRDSFTDVNGTLLSNHIPEIGGKWGVVGFVGTANILNNKARGYEYHPLLAPSFDCYAQAVLEGVGTSFHLDINTPLPDEYGYSDYIEISNLLVWLNGVFLGAIFTSGALYKIERIGSTVYAYKNEALIGSALAFGTHHRFYINVSEYYGGFIDNYEAGGGVAPPVGKVDHLPLMGIH